jgi:hypothetical protein
MVDHQFPKNWGNVNQIHKPWLLKSGPHSQNMIYQCLIAIQFAHKIINSTTQGFTCVKVSQLPHSCPVFMTMPAFERTRSGTEELAMGE